MSTTNENKKGFLIIKRQQSQGIVINGNINIFIKKIANKNVQLAIKGPDGTIITRIEPNKEKTDG